MRELDSQNIHVIGIRLHNRHRETVGVLALILNNSAPHTEQEPPEERIAYRGGVRAAAVSIESQRLQGAPKAVAQCLYSTGGGGD